MYDVVVIGGGLNGLIAATVLAKAGLKTVVIERADRVGGCARTSEIAPGFRCPTLAHTASIDEAIVRMLGLERHGLRRITAAASACAPTIDGRALVLWRDIGRACEEIHAFSAKDAGRYPQFVKSFSATSGILRRLCDTPAPGIDAPSAADLFDLLKTGRRFRALGRTDAYRLIRWMPMAVADMVSEWFESEPLKATFAASGILGSFLGPASAGSAAVMMLLGAAGGEPVATGWSAVGGPGSVSDALSAAAQAEGVEIRTGIGVTGIEIADEVASAVRLTSGEPIAARAVVSSVDPKRTLLGFVDPIQLTPDFVRRVQNIRTHGTTAKINYAVSSMPRFAGLSGRDAAHQAAALSGRVRLARSVESIERAFDSAKYGGFGEEPWIELTIPSIADLSLAPAGQHVVSAYVQYAPYHLKGRPGGRPDSNDVWDGERERLGDVATRTIDQYAPGFGSTIVAREVITPLDLERTYGLTGGHIFHGELALDQLFVSRPLLGWARYVTPIRHLYLCGSGTHPGTGASGRSGLLAARAVARDLKRT